MNAPSTFEYEDIIDGVPEECDQCGETVTDYRRRMGEDKDGVPIKIIHCADCSSKNDAELRDLFSVQEETDE